MIKVELKNRIFDGRWQWLYFLILDVNDFLHIFDFEIMEGNTFQNFKVDMTGWDKNSSKYAICKWIREMQEKFMKPNEKPPTK